MGELRVPERGCRSGEDSIWDLKSGDAPIRNHDLPSLLTATWVCERTLPRNCPPRTAWQFGQAQFHWGNPPPAAEPRIFTCIRGSSPASIEITALHSRR